MITTGIPHSKILYLDIETAHGEKDIFSVPTDVAIAWQKVCEQRYATEKDDKGELLDTGSLYKRYAALYPEFGRIVCVSMGYFTSPTEFVVKAYTGIDERELLVTVSNEITRLSAYHPTICGHNLIMFDRPYLFRRSIIKGVELSDMFQVFNKKPWEVTGFIDTMEMWRAGANNLGSNSLESISVALGLKSPKEETSGDMVSTYFYMPEPGLKAIGKYCNYDVVSTGAVYLMLTKGLNAIKTLKVIKNEY